MKAFFAYRDRDLDLQQKLPVNAEALTQDLELNTLFNAMALGDAFLFEVAKRAVLSGLSDDPNTMLYRQDTLRDCLKNSSTVREIYDIAVASIGSEKKAYFGYFTRYPSGLLHRSIEVLHAFVGMLRRLRSVADEHAEEFESESFRRFFAMLTTELGDEYLASIESDLRALKFREGALISAELGKGNMGANYVLRKTPERKRSWIEWIFGERPSAYTVRIAERDESGAKALSEIRDRGINLVANALTQSSDHVLRFFVMVRTELAFYIGCLNLHRRLAEMDEPLSFPVPATRGERRQSFTGLYDVCLALTMNRKVVGNDLNGDNKDLVIITGANQGGKSTFLRSMGLAQLMMQCGMFVPAESFCSSACDGLFTHYKREEDTAMNRGKLDEELSRMSDIADNIKTDSVVLFNESFAATNEREGSEIAKQIVSALLEERIRVFFVTHLYEFARGFYERKMGNAIFVRAEREADGRRTFRLIEGEPLETSYGGDLYKKIFEADDRFVVTENVASS
jgi:DNA mismatch repair ATPase MutS